MTNSQEFTKAAPIIHTLNEAGYEAYFVGGAVRDLLLDLPIHDVDIATSAYPAEVQALFPRHFDVGLDHGTIMVCLKVKPMKSLPLEPNRPIKITVARTRLPLFKT